MVDRVLPEASRTHAAVVSQCPVVLTGAALCGVFTAAALKWDMNGWVGV